ncbi:MAG: enoyl-CoA hydratase-related protein [Chloroflexi bacterium]|nr:enoyl-CoA hydratase-related protein [Chloroflexota bacterium]
MSTILYDLNDGVATITLNRPDKYNAFNDTMIGEVKNAIKSADRDDAVRAVVITGAGKGFCAGQDLGDVDERSNITFMDHLRDKYNPMILAMNRLEKPIIAAINGAAAGAGVSLALAADIRVMSTKASLIFASFAAIGLVPDNGVSYYLPRIVGSAKALELFMLADRNHRISAEQALNLNLVSYIAEPEAFDETVKEVASRLASLPTRALGLTKRMVNVAWENSLEEQLDIEAQLQEAASRTADHHEGIQAFLDKREPQFTGK